MDNKPQKIVFDISTKAVLKIIGVLLAIIFLFMVRDIVIIFVVSLILTTLINPLADWFAKKRIPRALAVLLIYIVLLGALGTVITLLIPPLIEQSGALVKNIAVSIQGILERFPSLRNLIDTQELVTQTENNLGLSNVSSALSRIFSTVTGLLGGLVSFVLILVLTFYMVVEGDALKKFFRSIAPEKYQPHLVGLMTRAQHKMGLWLRGTLILGLIVGLMAYVGLLFLGVNYALVLAILAGLLELIPYLGPPVSAVPAVILAFSQAPIKGLLVVILYIIVQQLENHVLVPKVMQKTAGLNPVVSILAMGIGYTVAGVLGALLSIPLATAASVFIGDFIELKKRKID